MSMRGDSHVNEMTQIRSLYQTRINKLHELGYHEDEIQIWIDGRKQADAITDRSMLVDRKRDLAEGLGDLVELVKSTNQKSILEVLSYAHELYPSKMNGR